MLSKTARYIAFSAILVASFLTVINTNMIRVASPHLQETLDVNYSNLSWVFNSLSDRLCCTASGIRADR